MTSSDPRLLVLSERDNILVLAEPVEAGEILNVCGTPVQVQASLGLGHKLARSAIPEGKDVLKYGLPIGFAARDISIGEHVHVHNLTSRYTVVEVME
ncbi:MAG: UxaA family hydrolase [Pseudomonadota bacterium]